jgi:diketogulonate reductase-like aldo/keto reductase
MIHNFQIGLGGGVPDGPSFEALDCALKCGIRFFDTSTLYSPGDFDRLNECLQSNQVKRSEVHISLKLWLSAFEKNRQFDYDPFKFSIKENIKAYLLSVNLDYLDSVVIHWPLKVDAEGFPEEFIVEEIWPQLELLVASGIVKEIGVSNFNIIELQRLLAIAKVHPFANQIEFSPFAFNIELKKFCLDHNIRVVGHSPFNYGWKNNQLPLLKNKIVIYKTELDELTKKFQLQVINNESTIHKVTTFTKVTTNEIKVGGGRLYNCNYDDLLAFVNK